MANPGKLVGKEHHFPVRVYYEDTDAAGIVFYANYLRYAERARSEFLRLIGFENSTVKAEHGVVFAVRRCEVDYLRPARLDDRLDMVTRIIKIGGASTVMSQDVFLDGQALVKIVIVLVCMTDEAGATRIPAPLREKFEEFLISET
ncbi:MAG: tol-pal system-associated acyl-CoA thioesterase [Magnetospiraceae bacterium]